MSETIEQWAARAAASLDWAAFHRVFTDEGEAAPADVEAMELAGLLYIEHGERTPSGGLCWGADGERLLALEAYRAKVQLSEERR